MSPKLQSPEFVERPIHLAAVDDSRTALRILENEAYKAGFRFTSTIDPLKAEELIRKVQPDVVILDIEMPGMDGFELCSRLKDSQDTRLIPVVMVTALKSREDRLKGIDAGCDDFMSKPVDTVELTARVRSLARVRRLTEHLEDAAVVLESLARAVEAKDGATGAHCDRLAEAGLLFGRFLGLDRKEVEALRKAGALHDLGKIAVPDHVLLKPGPLTEDEWIVIKRHPVTGAELLAPLKTMDDVIPVVRHHHERWNGNGYPDGLAGEAIPKLARVFQLLDAYDALVTLRPYKPPMCPEEARARMEELTEQGFWDPILMKRFGEFLDTSSIHPWAGPRGSVAARADVSRNI